jgi:hypothetical protein
MTLTSPVALADLGNVAVMRSLDEVVGHGENARSWMKPEAESLEEGRPICCRSGRGGRPGGMCRCDEHGSFPGELARRGGAAEDEQRVEDLRCRGARMAKLLNGDGARSAGEWIAC